MKLKVKVIPSSSKDCLAGWLEDSLKIKVKAPPEKDKANNAVIKLLEKNLELTKGSVHLSSGSTSSRKIIEIECDNAEDINKKLEHIINN